MAPPYDYKEMLESTAYQRMLAEHRKELEPARVFFTHDPRSAIDRRASFQVKAALVYEAVTGGHHDDNQLLRACRLLLLLAEACHSAIYPSSEQKTAGDHERTGTGEKETKQETGQGDNKGSTGAAGAAEAEKTAAPELKGDQDWPEEKKRVVDGIFLVVGFLPRLMDAIARSADRDGVDDSFKSHHMLDIVADVIKLENQLPLRDLLAVVAVVEGVVKNTVARVEEFRDVADYKLPFTTDTFGNVVRGFCWYYSPFVSKRSAAVKDLEDTGDTLLDCLHRSVLPKPKPAPPGERGDTRGRPSRMPAARELRRSGVRLQANEAGRAEVEFLKQSATLRLPALAYDFKLATVARNLLAREHGAREYEAQSKPVTRYFQMLNELVEDAADVRVLRRAGAVRGGSAAAQEVYALIKDIDGHATYPSVCMAIDREIEKVREYHDKRMKNFFVRNRPGVIWASSVAAVSVVAIVAARRNRG